MAAFIDITPLAINGASGSAALATRTQNVAMINHFRPATTQEQSQFAGANSVVFCNSIQYNQSTLVTIVSSQTVAALKSAIAA